MYYERWLASRRISASRAYTDSIRARVHVLPHWKDRPLCTIRPSDVDDWIADLSRKMGPHSIRHCYTLFRGPLRRAVKDWLIDDPCIDVPLPKKPDLCKTFDDVLSAVEVDQLVAAIADRTLGYAGLKTNGRYEALVFMAAWLGPALERGDRAAALRHQPAPAGDHLRQGGCRPDPVDFCRVELVERVYCSRGLGDWMHVPGTNGFVYLGGWARLHGAQEGL